MAFSREKMAPVTVRDQSKDEVFCIKVSDPDKDHPGEFKMLFKIMGDGTVERGPAFTTVDAMSLRFWDIIQEMAARLARPAA